LAKNQALLILPIKRLEKDKIVSYYSHMQVQNAQLRVTLPVQLQSYLQVKANKLGLSLSSYVKNLIINDVRDIAYPSFPTSDLMKKWYKQALKERNQAVEVGDLDEYFNNL